MGDRIDDLEERVQAVEAKMDQVPATIDQRFDAVDAAFVEQRQFTEFAFEKLERNMNARFGEVDARFAGLEAEMRTVSSGLGRVERKLDQFIDLHVPPPRSDTPDEPK